MGTLDELHERLDRVASDFTECQSYKAFVDVVRDLIDHLRPHQPQGWELLSDVISVLRDGKWSVDERNVVQTVRYLVDLAGNIIKERDAARAEVEKLKTDIVGLQQTISNQDNWFSAIRGLVVGDDTDLIEAVKRAVKERDDLRQQLEAAQKALTEREGDMHMRIRADYDKTIADAWRAKVAELKESLAHVASERNAAIAEAKRLQSAAEGYQVDANGYRKQAEAASAAYDAANIRADERNEQVKKAHRFLIKSTEECDDALAEVARLKAELIAEENAAKAMMKGANENLALANAHAEKAEALLEMSRTEVRTMAEQIKQLFAERERSESGDPPRGSRLWRCEHELTKARGRVSELEAKLSGGPQWLADAAEALGQSGAAMNWNQVLAGIRDLRYRVKKAERLHSEAEAQIECRNEMRARINELEAELARVRAEAEHAEGQLAQAGDEMPEELDCDDGLAEGIRRMVAELSILRSARALAKKGAEE